MIPIDRVIKNQTITNEKLDFESMDLNQLDYHYKKYKSLLTNKTLINSLKDKGERIQAKIVELEVLIKTKCQINNTQTNESIDFLLENFNRIKLSKKNEVPDTREKIIADIDNMDRQTNEKIEAKKENFEAKFKKIADYLDDEKARQDLLNDLNSVSNLEMLEKASSENDNYFQLKNTQIKQETKQKEAKSLNEIKLKILDKYKLKQETSIAKTIPLSESIKLIQEQTKRTQELQMQAAAEKILKGGTLNNFDYSFAQKPLERSANKYRERPKNEDENIYDDDSENDEFDSCSNYSSDEDSNEEFKFQRQTGPLSGKFKNLRSGAKSNNEDDSDDCEDELSKLD